MRYFLSNYLLFCGCINWDISVSDTDTDGNFYSNKITVGGILKKTRNCEQLEDTALFKTDEGSQYDWTIPICKITINNNIEALWWRADADIDLDEETSAKTSDGKYLNSTEIPYFTVPYPSNGFNPLKYDLYAGKDGKASVGIIIYEDRFIYAIFGNYNGNGVIGDVSQKAAKLLNIPNESVGGITYIIFTGENYVYPLENYQLVTEFSQNLIRKILLEEFNEPTG